MGKNFEKQIKEDVEREKRRKRKTIDEDKEMKAKSPFSKRR